MLKSGPKSYFELIKKVIFPAFLCLIFGHLLLKDYMIFPAVALIGLLPIFLILFHVLIKENESFVFILIIYVCSHFSYADNQGGLWNLISLGLIIFYFFDRPQKILFRPDPIIKFLIIILILFNICGYVVHSEDTLNILRGALAFFSYVTMFLFIGNHEITTERFQYFFLTTFIVTFYMFIVGLNQHFVLINFNTPILGGYSVGSGGTITYATTRAQSILGNYELFGEHAAVFIAFVAVFVISEKSLQQTDMNRRLCFVFIIILFSNVLLSGTRSSFLLALLGPAIVLLFAIIFKYKIVDAKKKFIGYAFVILFMLFLFGNYIGLETLIGRMSEILSATSSRSSFQDVISGKLINRDYLYIMGIERLANESWIFGYGYGSPERNISAWFGHFVGYSGLHSLYLSLPMIYGWTGAIAFILLILTIMFRLLKISIVLSNNKTWYISACIGFFLMFIILLANEYKISFLRNPNYHMVVWMWLGFANALYRTIWKKQQLKIL